jgi:acetyltransferase-like isoleucine patch superfamily enzyme
MDKNLIILGAGQYGSVVKEIAEEMRCFNRIAFLDDGFGQTNITIQEIPIGRFDELSKFRSDFCFGIPAIGNPDVRLRLIRQLVGFDFTVPILISPRAFVSKSAQINIGTVIEPLAVVHSNASIGIASYISSGAVVNHNSVVMDGCHVDNNAVVMSGAIVPSKVTTEPNEVMRRQTLSYDIDNSGYVNKVGKLDTSKTPDMDLEWVKQYRKEIGHDPSFFE